MQNIESLQVSSTYRYGCLVPYHIYEADAEAAPESEDCSLVLKATGVS